MRQRHAPLATYNARTSVERQEDKRIGYHSFREPLVEKPIRVPQVSIWSPICFVTVHIYDRKSYAGETYQRYHSLEKHIHRPSLRWDI